MKVDEFGFGFPPRAFGLQKINGKWRIIWGHPSTSRPQADSGTGQASRQDDQTIYSINWIPLGGFVKIVGENNEHEDDPRSFINKPFWSRFFTLIAGVLMNVILAWILISTGFIIGLPAAVDSAESISPHAVLKDARVGIIEVSEGQPADKAGIMPGDVIVSIDGRAFTSISEVSDYIKNNAGKSFEFALKRQNQELNLKVDSNSSPQPGQGSTGIALANIGTITVPWHLAFWEGAKATVSQLVNIVNGLYGLVTGNIGLSNLGGPIKIAKLTGEVADMGFIYLLQFTSFLSLNLAVLNVLPFPALDGGRILFLIIEKIRGRRNNQKLEQIVNTAGFVFLLLLMLLVTIKDVKGLW